MFCNKCGKQIDEDAKFCNYCGVVINNQQPNIKLNVDNNQNPIKTKNKIYKKWWFWLLAVVITLSILYNTINTEMLKDNLEEYKKLEVTVIDLSTMSKEDIQNWFDNNQINGSIVEEYSNSVQKGKFVSQSVKANTIIHKGDRINVIYSLGKEPSKEEKNALKKAQSYSKTMHMSKKAIFNQLTSSVEGFSKESAQYAIDNIDADWNKNALEKAKSYQETMSMSKKAIYNQLTSEVEAFTESEAQYAIDN